MTTSEIAPATATAERPTGPPGRPAKLSHAAYITHDTGATVRFYTEMLGMDLVNAVLDDKIPSTGDPVPYFHSFFKMADGSTIAFFEAPDLPPLSAPPHPAYDVFQHIAMEVATSAEVDTWHQWLVSQGVDVLGPVDHKIIYSIYFHDPNGMRLEITAPLDPTWNDRAGSAQQALAEWEEVKAEAKQSGRDMVTVLAELTRRRSHQRGLDVTLDGDEEN
jgi:catechol 2,3-dioxygenase-like lactoylglutathione lyase family enzyme